MIITVYDPQSDITDVYAGSPARLVGSLSGCWHVNEHGNLYREV